MLSKRNRTRSAVIIEMPEHGASQRHVVELKAARARQALKSRETRLGQSFKHRRRIDEGRKWWQCNLSERKKMN